jgi:gamma-glutamyltranspeptidase/glutathione hydrolase
VLARRLVEGSAAAGVPISAAELERAVPQTRPAIVSRYDGFTLYFAPPPSIGGATAAQLWAMVSPRWRSAAADERPHLFADASLRQRFDRARWIDSDLNSVAAVAALASDQRARDLMATYRAGARTATGPVPPSGDSDDAGASFVVADQQGLAIACAMGLGPRFGSGRMIAGTGLFQAAPVGDAGRGYQSSAAVLAVGDAGGSLFSPLANRSGQIVFAAAAGGEASGAALAAVSLRALVDGRPIGEAVDAARLRHGAGDEVEIEEGAEGRLPGLAARGYGTRTVPFLGRVNALSCPQGLSAEPTRCRLSTDPRGYGMSTGGN